MAPVIGDLLGVMQPIYLRRSVAIPRGARYIVPGARAWLDLAGAHKTTVVILSGARRRFCFSRFRARRRTSRSPAAGEAGISLRLLPRLRAAHPSRTQIGPSVPNWRPRRRGTIYRARRTCLAMRGSSASHTNGLSFRAEGRPFFSLRFVERSARSRGICSSSLGGSVGL